MIKLLPDGRIVVVGEVATGSGEFVYVNRFMPDGSLDPSGGQGSAGTYPEVFVGDAEVKSDGTVVIVGPNIFRFLPSGALDVGFGASGYVAAPQNVQASGVAIQTDGKLVVAGTRYSDTDPATEYWVARYLGS